MIKWQQFLDFSMFKRVTVPITSNEPNRDREDSQRGIYGTNGWRRRRGISTRVSVGMAQRDALFSVSQFRMLPLMKISYLCNHGMGRSIVTLRMLKYCVMNQWTNDRIREVRVENILHICRPQPLSVSFHGSWIPRFKPWCFETHYPLHNTWNFYLMDNIYAYCRDTKVIFDLDKSDM